MYLSCNCAMMSPCYCFKLCDTHPEKNEKLHNNSGLGHSKLFTLLYIIPENLFWYINRLDARSKLAMYIFTKPTLAPAKFIPTRRALVRYTMFCHTQIRCIIREYKLFAHFKGIFSFFYGNEDVISINEK